ncbi:MAG TPA: electron transfer flavoprotein subunit alpha/FixB family protein [Vicinamibacterales bacterium]|nr:electron transfer flavoprotein subunit alpha/FixB family protein [Vicinamibacterales bacterium]
MILAVAEQREGTLNRASWEAIAAAQRLAAQTGLGPVRIAIAGGEVAASAASLAEAECAEVVALEAAALGAYTADGFTAALARLLEAEAPAFALFAHTYQARDFVPKLAARLGWPLVTDVTGYGEPFEGRRTFTRLVFQGKLAADVVAEGDGPCLVTVQAGAFPADGVARGASPAPVRRVEATADSSAIRQKPEPPFQEAKQAVDLSQASRIVAVGRGIKEQSKLALVEELARALGAEIAASRPICDAGWLPLERQVGSSGQTVSPKLYLALGISGAIQHAVGMKGSRTIVAINKDAEAPIFELADYGIVGDLFEVVPELVKELGKSK